MFGTVVRSRLRSSPGSARCKVDERTAPPTERLLGEIDQAHADLGRAHERFLRLVAEVDRHKAWADDGARDLAQWLWMRYGISDWKARRFIDTAAALPQLPAIADALSRGQLGIDKVMELTRFATFDNEDGLIPWGTPRLGGPDPSRGQRGACPRDRGSRRRGSIEVAHVVLPR
jgi:hypothetical protein